MATISTDTYLDGGTARTAGETWTINSGAKFTVRTDSRWHLNSPASYTGSLGSQTCNEGEIIYDGRNVRWLAITDGSGTPAIGDTISQGGVSGYYLGFWTNLTAQPTLEIGAVGFIKFREVTGGKFNAGALTFSGAGSATAEGEDVTGWIEVVGDDASTITVPRLGKHTIRGDWFYLDNTDGTLGQVIQIPTNGGGVNTYCPGIWVEDSPGANTYEYWPSLVTTAGWSRNNIGAAYGETDRRQNFVKSLGSGQVQFGEDSDLSATYASFASQTTTYATIAHSSIYTVVNNICTVYYTTGHLLKTGAQVGVDFTSGGASTLDGNFTITVIDAYYYTFALTTADTSGSCTVRPGVTMTFTAHALGVGDTVYCDATTGTLPDGNYTIYAVTSANAYLIAYPHTVALTGGSAAVQSRYEVTFTAHSLAVGNRVYLDFTTGAGVNGLYTIVEVPTVNTFRVVMNNNGAVDSGNVTVKQTIGNIPASGCKIRIPNVFLRGCATASRASNFVNATITSRPEWATTTAGAIDLEYAYSTWYHNYAQAYSVKIYHSSTFDSTQLTECATAIDLDDFNSSCNVSIDARVLQLTSNFAGGTVKNSKLMRYLNDSSDHGIELAYCIGITLDNITAGVIQYVRSTGQGIALNYCTDVTVKNCHVLNSYIPLVSCIRVHIENHDHTDRYIGYTSLTSSNYAITIGAGSVDCVIDGITHGYNGTIINNHPHAGLVSSTNGTNIKIRNAGTFDSPLVCGNWRPNFYAIGYVYNTVGNNNKVKIQRFYIDDNMRVAPWTTQNSDKNITFESIFAGKYIMGAMAIYLQVDAGLNSIMKGCRNGATSVSGQSSVYGTHFNDIFMGDTTGRFVLPFNEPTSDTTSQFVMISGTAKFNSVGGLLMGYIGDQCTFEDSVFRKGHTGFNASEMIMTGGTYTNYNVQYQLDSGGGYGILRNLSYIRTATAGVSGEFTFTLSDATGIEVDDYIFGSGRVNIGKVIEINGNIITSDVANSATVSGVIRFNHLPNEVINPSIGFKMKYQITTILANITAITFIRIETISTASAQKDNLYDLDQYKLSLTGLEVGTKVAFLETGTEAIIGSVISQNAGSVSFDYSDTLVGNGIDIAILAPGYLYQKITNYILTSTDASIPVVQNIDYGYDNAISAMVTFNGTTKRIISDTGATAIDVVGVYTEWVDWALTDNNLRYNNAFNELGGNTIDPGAGTKVPVYGFLVNTWRISPDEANHTLSVTGGIILVDGGGDPFVNTVGAYIVRINYQQPVQAIVVSSSGGDPWATDLSSYNTSGTAGKKLKDGLTTGKFLGLK